MIPPTRDRAGILTAAASGLVELDDGDWVIETPPSPTGGRRPYDILAIGGAEMHGVGPTTVLRFIGDAGGIDWHGVALTSGSVHDLTIDTSALTGKSEQTHAIRCTGPATGPSIYRVTFNHPVRGTLPGGDAIQFVGYATTPIIGARVRDNNFAHADRSGIAAHSGCHDMQITGNLFSDIGDQCIDQEGTGDHFDWLIEGNTFCTGPNAQGDMAVQLMLVDRCLLTNNKFYGRGIFVYSGSHVEIDHNTIIRTTAVSGVGAIEIQKSSSVVNIHDNTIVRDAAAGTGYVVRIGPHGTGAPDHVTIANNVISQGAAGDVINATGIVGLHIDSNTVMYSGAAHAGYGLTVSGSAGATPIRSTDIELDSNTWVGPLTGCVGLNGAYGGLGSVAMTNNTALGPAGGVICGNSAGITGPVTATGNSWPAPRCPGLLP